MPSQSLGRSGLELLRQGHEVVTDGNVTIFLTEEDAESLLTDPRFDAVAMAVLHLAGITDGPLHDLWSHLMFGKDGDEHRRIRSTVAKRFTPSGLQRYQTTFDAIADELAAALPDDGRTVVDLWPAYSLPLAARTACVVVGISDEDALRVAAWALLLVRAFGVVTPEERPLIEQAAVEFTAYLDELVAEHRYADDSVLDMLLTEHADTLTYDETRALAANLVFGGLEAVTKALLTGVHHLLEHGLWDRLGHDEADLDHAVAELLRFHPPAGGVFRLAGEEIDVGGTVLQPGELAVPNLWAACRDARRYDSPDELRLDRKPGRPHPFGAGAHFCIGYAQAKVVLATGLRALRARAPQLALAVDPADLHWSQDPFDGLDSLPVRIGAAR